MPYIPRVYRPPTGGPLRWQDDETGALPEAVRAFLAYCAGPTRIAVTAAQIELVRDYCEYYIGAPCWTTHGMEAQFAQLRSDIKAAHTAQALVSWLRSAFVVGIDPL